MITTLTAFGLLVLSAQMGSEKMLPPERIFSIIEDAASMRESDVATVASLFHSTPKKIPEWSTPYVDVFTADISVSAPFRTFEMRVPSHPQTANGLIILSLAPADGCVSSNDITRKYGSPPEYSPPNARQPADAPEYFIYRRSWGDLKFGVSRSAPYCLLSVVIDWEVKR